MGDDEINWLNVHRVSLLSNCDCKKLDRLGVLRIVGCDVSQKCKNRPNSLTLKNVPLNLHSNHWELWT